MLEAEQNYSLFVLKSTSVPLWNGRGVTTSLWPYVPAHLQPQQWPGCGEWLKKEEHVALATKSYHGNAKFCLRGLSFKFWRNIFSQSGNKSIHFLSTSQERLNIKPGAIKHQTTAIVKSAEVVDNNVICNVYPIGNRFFEMQAWQEPRNSVQKNPFVDLNLELCTRYQPTNRVLGLRKKSWQIHHGDVLPEDGRALTKASSLTKCWCGCQIYSKRTVISAKQQITQFIFTWGQISKRQTIY